MSRRAKTIDMFDGVYDNPATKRREVYKDGVVCRYAGRNCCGDTWTSWEVLREPWGFYPPPPSYQPPAVNTTEQPMHAAM